MARQTTIIFFSFSARLETGERWPGGAKIDWSCFFCGVGCPRMAAVDDSSSHDDESALNDHALAPHWRDWHRRFAQALQRRRPAATSSVIQSSPPQSSLAGRRRHGRGRWRSTFKRLTPTHVMAPDTPLIRRLEAADVPMAVDPEPVCLQETRTAVCERLLKQYMAQFPALLFVECQRLKLPKPPPRCPPPSSKQQPTIHYELGGRRVRIAARDIEVMEGWGREGGSGWPWSSMADEHSECREHPSVHGRFHFSCPTSVPVLDETSDAGAQQVFRAMRIHHLTTSPTTATVCS